MSTVEKTVFLYGDESYASEIVTYGFVIIPAQNSASVESALKEVKVRHGLPEDVGIHCRNLFNKKARTKTAFAKFSTNEMFRFLDELMTSSFVAGARGWVGYLDTQKAPDALLFASDGRTGIDRWDVRDLKNRMMFCYQAASAPLMHIFPPSRVKAFVDGDRTKIPHFEKRRKVDSLRSFFPVEHNNVEFFPEAIHGLKPSPLDLADLLAYAAARGLSKAAFPNKSMFVSIVEAIDPGYSEVIFEMPSGSGAMFKIRAYDPADRVKSYVNQFL